ncbi:MAG: DNA polymerase III subunit [Chloroflexi bacterium]|nr:DNA polymerase III subunit [Chloroflexota bacterium]
MSTEHPWGIVGHERAVDLLRRSIQHRRIGHAYLISGPLGVGKRTLAVRLAQALNCERLGPGVEHGPLFADEAAAGDPPCGACRRCRLIESGGHPEVRVVGVQAPHRVIRVADVESIQADASLRAADVYRKVYILEQAELLHPDAANRLLKTIEEPPPSVVMVLTTVDPEATLETIVSRCQHLRLKPLERERLTGYLAQQSNVEPERAELIAALADGCVGRALDLAGDSRALERRAKHLDELTALLSADRVGRLQFSRTLGDRWSKDQDSVRETLQVWLRWWRDVLLLQGGLAHRIVNLDRRGQLERLARTLDARQAGAAVESVRDILQMLDQNVNARLALDVVALDLPRTDRVA